MSESAGEFVLYGSDDGQSLVQLRAIDGTAWLTHGQLMDMQRARIDPEESHDGH